MLSLSLNKARTKLLLPKQQTQLIQFHSSVLSMFPKGQERFAGVSQMELTS